jgi:hypothetical protein
MSNILGIATKYPQYNQIRCHQTQESQEAWHNIDCLGRVPNCFNPGKHFSVFKFFSRLVGTNDKSKDISE